VACPLTAAECFRKHVVTADLPGLKAGKDGWWSMPCPAGHHGKPVRLCVGNYCHIYWTDLGHCPDAAIFAALVKLGMPRECLKRPNGSKQPETRQDADLAGTMLDVAFGEGSATERMVAMVVAALDGELPEGPMVGVLARNLGVSERTLYRVTADARRRNRSWQ
jgi:hypothetical protein